MVSDAPTVRAGQEPQALVESGEQLRGRHRPGARRGELDGERNPVEPAADLLHSARRLPRRSRDRRPWRARRTAPRRVPGPSGPTVMSRSTAEPERLSRRGEHMHVRAPVGHSTVTS